ncbi:MAG: ferredoxin [Methanomicrobiaceae archaeon]|nr:ferredoxin [Methanomicrobiaceae archaeon]
MKVTIDREGCTSCGACWEECPEMFEENPDDGLSQVVEEHQIGGDPARGDVPKDLEVCVQNAADGCPVEVITLEE